MFTATGEVVGQPFSDRLHEGYVWGHVLDPDMVPPKYTPEGGWEYRAPLASTFAGLEKGLMQSGDLPPALIHLANLAFHAQADRHDTADADARRYEKALLRRHEDIFGVRLAPHVGALIEPVATGKHESIGRLRLALDLARRRPREPGVLIPSDHISWRELTARAARALRARALREHSDFYGDGPEGEQLLGDGMALFLGEVGLIERHDAVAPDTVLEGRAARLSGALNHLPGQLDAGLWAELPPATHATLQAVAKWTAKPLRKDPLRRLVHNATGES